MNIGQPKSQCFPVLQSKTFLICLGAAKCATSWLHHYLGSKPEVAVSPLKEVHFFDARFPVNAFGDADAFALARLALHMNQPNDATINLQERPTFQASVDRAQMIYDDDAYFAHFARLCTPDTQCICDITPAYSAIGPDGFQFVREFFASHDINLKLLFIMRDPVDRFWSQLRHLHQSNPDRKVLEKWKNALSSPVLLARANYEEVVTTLDQTFAENHVQYLFYEELFDGEDALRRLCQFADIPFTSAPQDEFRNETTYKQSLSKEMRLALMDLLQPQYEFCRKRFGPTLPQAWLR